MIAEFAQIVGLLAAFSSERHTAAGADVMEFLVWLSEHNHSDLRRLIEGNQATTISIKAMLYRGIEDIGEKLDAISNQLAVLATRSHGVEGLAAGFARVLVSDQAWKILTLMEESGTEFFLVSNELGGAIRLVLSSGPNYVAEESRFLHDDLELMVTLGLLKLDHNSRGDPLYRYTRAASKLVAEK